MKEEVSIEIKQEGVTLQGTLTVPPQAKGIVLFAHGSGSSRFSSRNQFVANVLVHHKMATLLFDLLTSEEEKIDDITRELRFDIPFLAKRLIAVTHWIRNNPEVSSLKIAYFGASTGSAAALIAGAEEKDKIIAIVSRGGRPDLALKYLADVKAPTLLIVGGNDYGVIDLNKEAFKKLTSIKKLEIVAGATHLFEEMGALEAVADLASNWFEKAFAE
ncbi:MAG: dienelactone hydrolase family protein [Chlamydiales bacterium]|nr:dienelactone hydrolase family protein [Chlamydiales bacterium]